MSKNVVGGHGSEILTRNNKNEKGPTFSFSLPLINNYYNVSSCL